MGERGVLVVGRGEGSGTGRKGEEMGGGAKGGGRGEDCKSSDWSRRRRGEAGKGCRDGKLAQIERTRCRYHRDVYASNYQVLLGFVRGAGRESRC